MAPEQRVLVIGAGIGGLTTAATLARQGMDVTVLEAHVYAGGCAGTFYHKGYRFDAGATLAGGFYAGGPMDLVGRAAGVRDWGGIHAEPAMVVHLPDGRAVSRWGDERRHAERMEAFGAASTRFWDWQERTADALWDLALRNPPWPPQSPGDFFGLLGSGTGWLLRDLRRLHPDLALDAFRPVASHLHGAGEALRLFVDAQLLIAAQATSARANALYGASALDLPRRGVAHFAGGMGTIADTLVGAIRRHGGQVHFRHAVTRIRRGRAGGPIVLETKRGATYEADLVVANLPPWNLAQLFTDDMPRKLATLPPLPVDGWGAFMVYAGIDRLALPAGLPLHHQVIVREPLGEGNTAFISLSPEWDEGRGPQGNRAVTISTHTQLGPWWRLFATDRVAYEERKTAYAEALLSAATRALPSLVARAELMLPGTPVTFQRFTRRTEGWVGGFPQTHLFRAWAPRLADRLWMVGDSIFPGQSTAAVALGGLRVAGSILRAHHSGRTARFLPMRGAALSGSD